MNLISSIDSKNESRHLLHDSSIFQFASVNGPDARDLRGKFGRDGARALVVGADDHIAVHWSVAIQKTRGNVVECSGYSHVFRHQFGGLLRG